MADIFGITAPLMIRQPDGTEQVIAHHFRHNKGLIYFDVYWHLGQPQDTTHILEGTVSGEGPWKIAGHVLNVLGCHGSNSELAIQFQQWQGFLQQADADYPEYELVQAIARRLGAITD